MDHIIEKVKSYQSDSLYKLRIVYNESEFSFEIIPYIQKKINSLKLIEAPEIEYSHKYLDRNALLAAFEKKGHCDDILISQEGAIKDTLYCNVAFGLEDNWVTPDMPLLKGTKRQELLDLGTIKEAEVFMEDLPDYNKIMLFNSCIDFGELQLDINQIDMD
jgi:4-amino-4-deoxychorismate lyase